MRKIKKGDQVVVLAGKDKGKQGTVSSVIDDSKVIVDNVNMVKKHAKGNPMKGEPGGIVDKEMPLDISNVGVFNPDTGKADRVGIKTLDDGRKVRYFKSSGEVVDI
ncbi:MAG: 50S ribosomal protein L24 [Gammaproteobacteria bacterium]|nr:50S ribosomal protein L24 [Gammaproteobacteria bacterium]MCP4993243.1 50S ribosomal protein L24 [Gammaproteobacteria bacterium]